MSNQTKPKSSRRAPSPAIQHVRYDERNFRAVVRFLHRRAAFRGELGGEMLALAIPEIEVELHRMVAEMVKTPSLNVVSSRAGVDVVRESLEGGTLSVYFMVNPLAGAEQLRPAAGYEVDPLSWVMNLSAVEMGGHTPA